MINLITVMGLDCFKYICKATGNDFPYENVANEIRQSVNEVFYREKEGAYAVTENGNEFCELANAFAVLTETATGDTANYICENLLSGKWVDCSLSMKN